MPPVTPLIALKDAACHLGGKPLFEGIDLSIARGERACLVGRNGSGKSTILKMLAGRLAPDAGERFVQPGTRIGWLEQDPSFAGFATVHDAVAAGLPPADADAAHRVEAVLDRLRLDGGRAPATLSGGEARRAALAQALVGDPDVLLLDEPTNHLDLPTIEWLEETLGQFRGGLLLISHDRAFLSALARTVLWLDRGSLRRSERGFAEFTAWQAEIFAAEEAAAHKLDRKIAAETKWLREGISARRTRNMGRVRALTELRRERMARVRGDRQVQFAIAEGGTAGRLVIEAEHVSKSFDGPGGQQTVVRDFSTRILRGDRVGVIGPNGAGKTTLLKLLTGALPPDAGTVRLGTNLEPIYFDQRRASLDPEATVRRVLCPHGGDMVMVAGSPRHVAGYIGDFLFDPRQIDSPVKALSGGERNRLLLARLFAQPSNLLILDEPTNDLDMDTLDLLEDVLGDYDGTLLLVSHDRDFLDRLVTATLVMEGDGRIGDYAGGYTDYLAQRPPPATAPKAAAKPAAAAPTQPRVRRKLGYQQQREFDSLPATIERLTAERAAAERRLADPALFARDPKAFAAATAALEQASQALADAEERWLELAELAESLDAGS